MGKRKLCNHFVLALICNLLQLVYGVASQSQQSDYISAIGDPGMRRDSLRVAIEAWNQCNEVGQEAPAMGSPRMADCFDVDNSSSPGVICIYLYINFFFYHNKDKSISFFIVFHFQCNNLKIFNVSVSGLVL